MSISSMVGTGGALLSTDLWLLLSFNYSIDILATNVLVFKIEMSFSLKEIIDDRLQSLMDRKVLKATKGNKSH